jgi:undecaprenyl-diphosphatase
MGALLMVYGRTAARPVLVMAITGLTGILIYKWLKTRLLRERPFIRHPGITLAMPPLDRYSFPSGHTLHAVSFTWLAAGHYPELALILIPLAALIAGSRVVLGLHYPSDVLAGGAIGATLATIAQNFM